MGVEGSSGFWIYFEGRFLDGSVVGHEKGRRLEFSKFLTGAVEG